jgi:hypothetical protein
LVTRFSAGLAHVSLSVAKAKCVFSAPGLQPNEKDMIMKTMSDDAKARKSNRQADEPRAEYKFDYGKAQPNRFAGRKGKRHVVVLLDPDVARVFTGPEAVNTALRAIISAIPGGRADRLK